MVEIIHKRPTRPKVKKAPRKIPEPIRDPETEGPISLVHRRIADSEVKARTMVRSLEAALQRSGYSRRGSFKERMGQRAKVALQWDGKHIQMVGWKDGERTWLGVDDLGSDSLLTLAFYLPRLLDKLERDSRWHLRQMLDALGKLEEFVEGVTADPQPDNSENEQSA